MRAMAKIDRKDSYKKQKMLSLIMDIGIAAMKIANIAQKYILPERI
jgi:hypothetical protein